MHVILPINHFSKSRLTLASNTDTTEQASVIWVNVIFCALADVPVKAL